MGLRHKKVVVVFRIWILSLQRVIFVFILRVYIIYISYIYNLVNYREHIQIERGTEWKHSNFLECKIPPKSLAFQFLSFSPRIDQWFKGVVGRIQIKFASRAGSGFFFSRVGSGSISTRIRNLWQKKQLYTTIIIYLILSLRERYRQFAMSGECVLYAHHHKERLSL